MARRHLSGGPNLIETPQEWIDFQAQHLSAQAITTEAARVAYINGLATADLATVLKIWLRRAYRFDP